MLEPPSISGSFDHGKERNHYHEHARIDRLKTIQAVIDGHLRASTAASRLQLTKRQVNRLVQRYRLEGMTGLVSHQRDQPGHRQLPPGLADIALTIIRERYSDFGPTLASGAQENRIDVQAQGCE